VYPLLRPLIFLLPAELAHRLGMSLLRCISRIPPLLALFGRIYRPDPNPLLETVVFGLKFATPIGLAAGLDKDGEAVPALDAMGFGFVEVGTVTPRAQPGNPTPRLFRLPRDRAVINRMGFNNHGAEAMAAALQLRGRGVLGVNLGKNKDTPLERAPEDYLAAFQALAGRADYVVINVSSPNTPGLRSLQSVESLQAIVMPLLAARDAMGARKPVLVKVAPDLELEDAQAIARACQGWGVDGLIVANTTLRREDLQSSVALIAQTGGLSGAPVRALSTAMIRALAEVTRLPIIGVGGVFTAEDAYEKIRAGASLIQVYTALIYEGPGLPEAIGLGLASLLARDGFANVREAVGADGRAFTAS
jgi:dihydroorotate dehydrogenase